MQNSSMKLTCHAVANPGARYAWFRGDRTLVGEEPQLFFRSLQASDCGEYYCTATNQLGMKMSPNVSVHLLCE